MRFKIPQNTENLIWTRHAIEKMKQYQLSEGRIRRVLHTPARVEEGIAPRTIAIMQPTGSVKRPSEIWVMYQTFNSKKQNLKTRRKSFLGRRTKIKIISVWRYPGRSPLRQPPPIPPEEWGIWLNPEI